MHALSVSLLRAKQLPVITNGLGASPHAGSTCTIGVVTVRPLNRLPARLYFKLKPDPNNTFFFIFTCTTQYPWVLANLNLSQAMAPSKKKRIHTVFRDSSAHRSALTSKPRFVGEKVRVSDAFDLRMGKTPSRKNPAYWRDGGHDWVSIADLGSFGKYVGVTKERINDLAISESGIKPAPANTVLMSFKLSLGKTSITTEPVYTNEAIMAFVDKGVYPVDASFMYHQCRAKDWTAGTNTAVMGKTLNKKTLGQAYVHLPALEVQKMIAARLDFIDEQIRASKSSADKLEHLVKSRFVEMFGDLSGYESRTLKECVSGIESGKSPKCLAKPREGNNPGVLKLSAISSGIYKETENKALPSDAKATDGRVVCDGDILLARKNTPELVGQSVFVKHTDGNIMFPDIVFRMHAKYEVDGVYLSHALAHPLAGAIKSLAHGSAKSMSNIPKSELVRLPIPLPPLALQREFAAFVAQVDKSRFVRDHEMNFR